MNRFRNYTATLALIASITAGFVLFTSCGPRPLPDNDPGTCAVDPGNDVAKTIPITFCESAPVTVSYGPSGTVLLEVNPTLDGAYTFSFETCQSYDFHVCGLSTGIIECADYTLTPEQIVNDAYDVEPTTGCDGDIGEDDDTTTDPGPCFTFDTTKPVEQCVYSQPDTLAIDARVDCCCIQYGPIGTFFLSIGGDLTAYECK